MTDPSFADFMAARWAPLFRTAYLLAGTSHDAEELLQSALARTCSKWDTIRDKGAADAYVRRAMVHTMTSRWRRPRLEVVTDELPDRGHGGGLDVRADHLALWEEIRKLPPRMRATLVLRYVEDRTEQQTADELGVSLGSVKSQTHHALKRLRAALGRVDQVGAPAVRTVASGLDSVVIGRRDSVPPPSSASPDRRDGTHSSTPT